MSQAIQSETARGKLTQSPAWQALQAHQAEIAHVHMRDLFAREPGRARKFSLEAGALLLDYSKHRVTGTTLALLADLARQQELAALADDAPMVVEQVEAGERARRAEAVLAKVAEQSEEAKAWLLGAREAALRADLFLAAREKARGVPPTVGLDDLAEGTRAQMEAMEDFMRGRYPASDVAIIREDRYESTLRMIGRLGE